MARKIGLTPVRSAKELREVNEELKQEGVKRESTVRGNVEVMFDGLNLSEMLAYLKDEGYTLDSVGFGKTWSISESITVCGFKSKEGFFYVTFYYDTVFMTRIVSTTKRIREVEINGSKVKLRKVDIDGVEDMSTLVRGFDVCNFHEYGLLETA